LSSSSPEGQLLVDEPAPHVTRLVISNPAKRGALDQAILDRFAELMPALEARCVIITGHERDFSAGYDIGGLPESAPGADAQQLVAHPFAAALDAIEAYPYPTIAALNGHTIGGGLELALSCDLRIASDAIKLAMPPAKLGLVYSHTGIKKFIDAIGAPRTRELLFLGSTIDAATAQEWGLVNRIAPVDELTDETVSLAKEIAANAPLSQRGNKRVIAAVLASRGALEPELERELMQLRLDGFASDDFREGVRAFAEKRPPRWQGR
jgi:enoyl-CoA hydratase/carnithine racemase